MSELAIRVGNVSKMYRIGVRDTHKTLRDALVNATKRPFQRAQALFRGSNSQQAKDTFWALKNVSFEVKQGEVLGIIGRNGAGKSTLLKLLSRITEPTEGRIEGYGRVGSLLEVGTGFHPELTGRENVYLNGAILGMKKSEIDRKFDEIVAFAEIEQFLDTPVKRYSSGMYVRLAFAVAAHLEPEILIVDEVLAVGDVAFQNKCLGKMGSVAKEGRTVLFVTHNMGAVQALCRRGILLKQGTILTDDTVVGAVSTYLRGLEESASQNVADRTDRLGKGQMRIVQIEISRGERLAIGRPARFGFHVTGVKPGTTCSFTIYDQLGQRVTYFDSALHSPQDYISQEEGTKFLCEVDELPLLPARYRINVAITCNGELQDHLEGAAFFEVESGNFQGRPVSKQTGYCSVIVKHRWITP
jgi:homopolymeric O-antigen transport system ATP-binding protein